MENPDSNNENSQDQPRASEKPSDDLILKCFEESLSLLMDARSRIGHSRDALKLSEALKTDVSNLVKDYEPLISQYHLLIKHYKNPEAP
jgi:hypothetical protein